jgi:hypothetical protein
MGCSLEAPHSLRLGALQKENGVEFSLQVMLIA